MKVVFRVDASQYIGSGHVMRCLVLAEALRLNGHMVIFATREQNADLNVFIKKKGFNLIRLMQPSVWKVPNSTDDYEAWLQVSEIQDYQDFVTKVTEVDLVIVDHYGLNALWHTKVKETLQCKLMVIDDLVRSHKADIVLDQTLNRRTREYTDLHPCLALTGTDYALLKPEFASMREKMLNRSQHQHTILISMGGVDLPNASMNVLTTLLTKKQKLPTTILLSKRSPNYDQVKSFALENRSWVKHIEFVDDMPTLMCQHTIMIGAPGSTSWERGCLGIPSIVVPIADNQKTIAQELKNSNAVKVVELNDISANLLNALQEIIAGWESYRRINFDLCDGLGCRRTVQQLDRFMKRC